MGYTRYLKKDGTPKVDINSKTAIVLPTLREETCIAPTVDKTISIIMTSKTSNIAEDDSIDDFDNRIDSGTSTGDTFSVVLN